MIRNNFNEKLRVITAWLAAIRYRGKLHAAEHTIHRCYGVPYEQELTSKELEGMVLLERAGLVVRDEGFTGRHWHIRRQ